MCVRADLASSQTKSDEPKILAPLAYFSIDGNEHPRRTASADPRWESSLSLPRRPSNPGVHGDQPLEKLWLDPSSHLRRIDSATRSARQPLSCTRRC